MTRRRKTSRETQFARFTPSICQLWRDLQEALRDRDVVRASNMESRLRMELGVASDRSLPVAALHRASHPGQKLSPMIELPNNYGATPPELSTGGSAPVDPVPLLEPQREILTRPLPSHAELLQMYGTLQDDLARYGITKATVDQQYALDSALCRIHRLDLFDPRLDALLEQLHVEAYAGVKPRPARLMARDGVMSLEDITVDLEG